MSVAWPLSGVQVVDLSSGLAGAYCAKLLADGGADVVKVEDAGGDPLRRVVECGAPLDDGADGALFRFLCASSESVVGDVAVARDARRAGRHRRVVGGERDRRPIPRAHRVRCTTRTPGSWSSR